jgi:hypothetical protein
MEEINKIFKLLEPNQELISKSLSNNSFLNKIENRNNIFLILFLLDKKLELKTEIEKNELFKKYIFEILEKVNNIKIQKLINGKIHNLTLFEFLSEFYKKSFFIYYQELDIYIKIGNYDDIMYLNLINNFVEENNELKNNKEIIEKIINSNDLKNYKKFKVNEIRELAKKLKIELEINNKKKIKNELLLEIKNYIDSKKTELY